MSRYHDIVYDSRKVSTGDLFCAVKGFTADGNDFIETAIKQGAAAILSEDNMPQNFNTRGANAKQCTWVKTDNVRKAMAQIAKEHYNIGFDDIFSVAVTGTNGKTSIAGICHNILSAILGKNHTALTGTNGNIICGKEIPAERTTPEAIDTLKMLTRAGKTVRSLVMEASSHALVLERLAGFEFDLAIFTNLTLDHLDFHRSMEEYYQAKKLLFTAHLKNSGIALINTDDEYGLRLYKELKNEANNILSIGFNKSADYHIHDAHCNWSGTFFKVRTPEQKNIKLRTKLIGHFNIINCAEAVCGLLAARRADAPQIIDALANILPIEGRIDKVNIDAPFSIIIDYAHTPDALIKILSTARKLTKQNLICVFGAGGNRDKSKRPLMAEAVAKNSDFAVLTSDNPRNENPQTIIDEVAEGFPLDFPYKIIPSRRDAIEFAIRTAQEGDAVIIAGKGHEKYQEISGVKHHFDDKETALAVFNS